MILVAVMAEPLVPRLQGRSPERERESYKSLQDDPMRVRMEVALFPGAPNAPEYEDLDYA